MRACWRDCTEAQPADDGAALVHSSQGTAVISYHPHTSHHLYQNAIAVTQLIDEILHEHLATGVFPPTDVVEAYAPSTALCKRLFFFGLEATLM